MPKQIVIIGNGAAGSQLAAALVAAIKKGKKDHVITVLEPKEYTEVSVLMTQNVAAGPEAHAKALYPPIREDGVTYIQEAVSELRPNELVTSNTKKVIPFDACVVAVGQKIPIFLPAVDEVTREGRVEKIRALHEKVKASLNLVISGGGATGCEFAADVKLRYPKVNVTVVDSRPVLLSAMSASFSPVVAGVVKKMNIGHVNNDRVERWDEEAKMVHLKSGKQLPCDLHVAAHPHGGNCGFMPEGTKDGRDYAKVNDYFQIDNPNYPHVFALGDCSSFDPIKTYIRIKDQTPTMVSNLLKHLEDKPMVGHKRAESMEGRIAGPAMVALGHGVPGAVGIGPDLPGCLGSCCWFCCCCQPPHGSITAKIKHDFNQTVKPWPGLGLGAK
jgi:NADH dehydrogenase FAD-containing subunit